MIGTDSVSSEEVHINAPAELVWQVILDFDKYPLWNDFCPQISGELELGAAVSMQVDLGDGLQSQTEYISRIEPPHLIAWAMENKPGDPVHAERLQYVRPVDECSGTYLTVDEFGGELMAPMIEQMGAAVESGFNRCAQGLKRRAEALYAESSADSQ